MKKGSAVVVEPEVSYQVLPPLSEKDYAKLRQSIIENGILDPVIVDENGNILDGHHRDRIATELGIGYKTDRRPGLAEHEKRLLAFEVNTVRRDTLTDAQMTIAGRALEPDYAERARLRQVAALKQGDVTPVPSRTSGRNGETRDEVAASVGISSGRTYERNKKVIEKVEEFAPQLMPALESGAITLREAAKDIRHLEKAETVAAAKAVNDQLDDLDPVGADSFQDARFLSEWTAAVARQSKAMTDLMSFDVERAVVLCNDLTRGSLENAITNWRRMADRADAALNATATLQVVKGGTAE